MDQSLNLPSRGGRDGSDEMVMRAVMVQGNVGNNNHKLQSCNLVMTKPSTVGTVEEESVTAK
ncbi:hypothetical protein HID58_070408 [Brassica napus]|uniref:Uncharacterized protein n=1 Tax=Brassica napus TaxID=3708 RepID=A0ABQ7YYN4_BRANA|nr:hypothetical protein HID58_070408 [Brassica napus]